MTFLQQHHHLRQSILRPTALVKGCETHLNPVREGSSPGSGPEARQVSAFATNFCRRIVDTCLLGPAMKIV